MSGFDHFNFIGPLYDKIFGRRVDQEIVPLLELHSSDRILDVGGGTGRVARLLKPLVQSVWIIDSAQGMLAEAREKDLVSVNACAEQLPFRQESFERIIIVDALHHVADQQKTLLEMWRVLAPGGRMIIEEPDISNLFVKLIALGEKLLLMRSHFLTPSRIAALVSGAASENIRIVRNSGIAWVIITKNQ